MTFSFIHFAFLFFLLYSPFIVVMSLSPPHLVFVFFFIVGKSLLPLTLLQSAARQFSRSFSMFSSSYLLRVAAARVARMLLSYRFANKPRKCDEKVLPSPQPLPARLRHTQGSKLKCLQSFRVFIRRHSLSFLPLFPLRFL